MEESDVLSTRASLFWWWATLRGWS